MATAGSEIAARAQQYLGLKYVWGGTSLTEGADCSGYLQSVFKQFGITIPRTTYEQINQGNKISMPDLRPGDLIFFDTDRSTDGPDHVGLYIGGGKFIHAPKPGDSVKISALNDGYYASRFMAGRRMDGVIGAGQDSADADSYEGSSVALQPEELAATYGWSYAFLKGNPELAPIFEQAVNETWTSDKFKAKIQETNWWKTTSDKSRQAQLLEQSDPATFAAKVQASTMAVRMKANELGAIVPENVLSKIGEDVMRTGMEDAELNATLSKYIDFTKEGTLAGQAGQAQLRLTQLARLNGVQISDQAVKNYAQQIAAGVGTMEQAEKHVRNMASSLFPSYVDEINAGVNMKDIANPYVQQMAQDLEMSPMDISLDNPLIRRGLNGVNEQGVPTGLNLHDFQQVVRADPRWFKTKNANDSLMKTGNDVLKQMGLMG